MTTKQAWKLYHEADVPEYEWEHPETNSGLLFPVCPACGARPTRKTYIGWWAQFLTLEQGLSVRAIAMCPACGTWLQINH